MSDKFTSEQRAAIDAQGRTIVSASAGSGKTTVMIEKIIGLIKTGTRVDEILAVTFTKKAAAQMKEKLSKALIETINADTTTPEKRIELKKRLSEVSSADISTIHSFCSKLIRSHFFAAGVDNAFRVIGGDDAEGTALKSKALDELFEEAYEEKSEQFGHLISVYWRKKSDNTLRKIFLTAYNSLRDRADYHEYLQRSGQYTEETFDGVCKDLLGLLREKCRYYQRKVEEELAFFQPLGGGQLSLANQLYDGLEEILSAPDYFSACAVQKPKYTQNRSSKNDTEEKRAHIERLGFLKDKIADIYADNEKIRTREEELEDFLCSSKTAAALGEYLLRFDEKYERLKSERGVLDYNDLEHKALRLLKDEVIVKEMREKYRYVFVDEYQDVNPVQEEIISRLSGDNLFLVGDVKQSIYGFRGSKSEFFVQKQKEFDKNGDNNLAMTRNFRSADAVLDAVNSQFSLAMTLDTSNVDYFADSVMESGGMYALNDGRVRVHFLGKEEKTAKEERGIYSVKAKNQKKQVLESRSAKLIRSIIEKEKNSLIYDTEIREMRPATYSDIAVLSRKKQGQIADTVAALAAEGVPVTAAAAVNICDYSEVKMLMDFLSLIDNAEQDVPLCSVLLSPVADLTADDLAAIRLAFPEETFFRNACKLYTEKTDDLAKRLQDFYAYLDKMRNLSWVLDAGELLTRLLTERHVEAALLSRENGVACLKRIHRFIEETYAEEPLSVHAFLDRLRALDYKIEFSENGGEDSVKVLTMHSSKGLEYPIVILDNLSAKFRGVDHDEVLVEEKYGLAPRAYHTEKMLKRPTLLRRLYEEGERRNSIADELNLYYVALTRAKYALHMIFETRTPMPNVRYATSFAEFTDFSVWEHYIFQDEIFDLPKQERLPLVFHPDEELALNIRKAFLWEYSHTGYENFPVKSSATSLLQSAQTDETIESEIVAGLFDKETEKLQTKAEEERRKKSLAVGLAYHAFLERFDFSLLYQEAGGISDALLREKIEDLYNKMQGDAEGAEHLHLEKLFEILKNPVFHELQGMRLYKEQQFLVSLPIKEAYTLVGNGENNLPDDGEEMIFQGAIDMLAVGETVRIIDYKYSTKNAEALKAHYRPQLALYRKATAKILKCSEEKIRCSIVNLHHGFQIDVE